MEDVERINKKAPGIKFQKILNIKGHDSGNVTLIDENQLQFLVTNSTAEGMVELFLKYSLRDLGCENFLQIHNQKHHKSIIGKIEVVIKIEYEFMIKKMRKI